LAGGGFPLDNNTDARDIKGSNNQPRGNATTVGLMDGQRLDNKEQILKDCNQIYPPSNKAGISQVRYSRIEKFAASMDAKNHQHLTHPPQQQKYTNSNVSENQTPGQSNRCNSWMGTNASPSTSVSHGRMMASWMAMMVLWMSLPSSEI
jgi:hypothetical protein